MAVQYSGGTYINVLYTCDGTIQSLINQLETQLLAAGWTTVSGHNTGTLTMQSAATPYPIQEQFVFKNNSGNGVDISLRTIAGNLIGANSATAGQCLLPTSARVYRIMATKYWFLVTQPGSFVIARDWVYGCVPYLPSFLTGVADCGLLIGGSSGDNSTITYNPNWRNNFYVVLNSSTYVPNFTVIYNNAMNDYGQSTLYTNTGYLVYGFPSFVINTSSHLQTSGGNIYNGWVFCNQWANGDLITSDALVAWGYTNASDIVQIRCQLWDCLIVNEAFPGDSVATFGGHTWFNLTHDATGTGQTSPRMSLWFATS